MSLSFFEAFLRSCNAHPLLDTSISYSDYIPLDLSIKNVELKNVDVSSSKHLESYVNNYIKNHNAKVAYGGYLEKRNIYQRSTYFNTENTDEERNVHLGIDLWIKAGTKIYAPLDGWVHSFNNNTNYGDYGPTLILEHYIEGFRFFTLYGHLSLESLKGKQAGQKIIKGQQIATLGNAEVNGDYPPHLHFQIIKDIQNYNGDYPGVSNKVDLEFYKQNCPDPNMLLKISNHYL